MKVADDFYLKFKLPYCIVIMHTVSFQDFTCPNCYSGFIEELEAPPDLTDDSDTEMEDVAPVEVKSEHLSPKV
jgi:hypothetical protein